MTDIDHDKIARLEKEISSSQDNLHMTAHKLRALISYHHKLASDIRSLLKMKLKIESSPRLKDYLTRYKVFLEAITDLHANVLSKDFTDQLVQEMAEQIEDIIPNVNPIFDDIFVFEGDENGDRHSEERQTLTINHGGQGSESGKTDNIGHLSFIPDILSSF
jgi:PI-3-kinase-related kinase SMG-1